MKRYIRSESDATKTKKAALKEAGRALKDAVKSYPEELPKFPYLNTVTDEIVEVKPKILSSIPFLNSTECFVIVDIDCAGDGARDVVDNLINYGIDQVADKYPEYKFRSGKYGGFRGYDLGVWITAKEN